MRVPICAPVTEPSSSRPASTMSTALVVSACIIVVAIGHEQDLEQRGADHDVGLMPEHVEHRRDQDEAAADAHQHRQDADHTPSSSGASGEM